jgi:hypothetical protein
MFVVAEIHAFSSLMGVPACPAEPLIWAPLQPPAQLTEKGLQMYERFGGWKH